MDSNSKTTSVFFSQDRLPRANRTTRSVMEENSLKIREIAQQNVYILFPNARDSLGFEQRSTLQQTKYSGASGTFGSSQSSKWIDSKVLPKLVSPNSNKSDRIPTMSTKASSMYRSSRHPTTSLMIGELTDTIVKPSMTSKRSEVNQVQGFFKDPWKPKASGDENNKCVDSWLGFDFPFHQMVDFVQNHSQGFKGKDNIDMHKHYQRMYIQNKFKMKQLRVDRQQRKTDTIAKTEKEAKELAERRKNCKTIAASYKKGVHEPEVSVKTRQFVLDENIKDLSEFQDLLNQYDEVFSKNNHNNNFNFISTYENAANLEGTTTSGGLKEGGLLQNLLDKQRNRQQQLHVVSDFARGIKENNKYAEEQKSIKIVEDIFLDQIMEFIRRNGIPALEPVDYFNLKRIVLKRKTTFKRMREELMQIIDIKRNIKNLQRAAAFESSTNLDENEQGSEDQKSKAKVVINDVVNGDANQTTMRRSQLDTEDYTGADSLIYSKNNYSGSLYLSSSATERFAIQPRTIDFIPPKSFLPKILDPLPSSTTNNPNKQPQAQKKDQDGEENLSNIITFEDATQNPNDAQNQKNNQANAVVKQEIPKESDPNEVQKTSSDLSNSEEDDENNNNNNPNENDVVSERQSIESSQSQRGESLSAIEGPSAVQTLGDKNQIEYLMRMNQTFETQETDANETEEAMRLKAQIVKMMMKDGQKAVLQKLTERMMSKIEERRLNLLDQIGKEHDVNKRIALQEQLSRENHKKTVQMQLLSQANTLKQVSHRLMYEADQQNGYIREDELDEATIEQKVQYFQTIFELISEDDNQDIVANYIIAQMDESGAISEILRIIAEQQSSEQGVDMEAIRKYIQQVAENQPVTAFVRPPPIPILSEEDDPARKTNNRFVISSNAGSPSHNKAGAFKMDNNSDEDEIDENPKSVNKSKLSSVQTPTPSSRKSPRHQQLQRTDSRGSPKSEQTKLKELKEIIAKNNNSSANSPKSSPNAKKLATQARSAFQKDVIDESLNQVHRREVMIQLRGKDAAKEILFEEFTAEQTLEAQEQIRLRMEEDQRKMKTLGQRLHFKEEENDPEMQRLKDLMDFAATQRKNNMFNSTFAKKVKKGHFERASSFEIKDKGNTKEIGKPGGLLQRSNSSEPMKKKVRKIVDAQGNIVYVDKFGKKIEYYAGLSKLEIEDEDDDEPILSNVFDQIEIEVTDSQASSATTLFDDDGNALPKKKKTKKVIVTVKRGSKGQILIDDALLSKLPPNMKIDAQGRLVKLTRIVNEDGTIVEVESVVETKVIGQVVRKLGKNGEVVEMSVEAAKQQLKEQRKNKKNKNKQGKTTKMVLRKLSNGEMVYVEVTDSEGDISIDTENISVTLSDEDPDRPLTPKTKAAKILAKQKAKKLQMKQEAAAAKQLAASQEQDSLLPTKKKIIKRIMKENGEYEEIIMEVSDTDGEGTDEIQVYDQNGNLISKTTVARVPGSTDSNANASQLKGIAGNKKNLKISNPAISGIKGSAAPSGNTSRKNQKKKDDEEEVWYNEDGTVWTPKTKKANASGSTTQRVKEQSGFRDSLTNPSKLSAVPEVNSTAAAASAEPRKIKKIIDGREIEFVSKGSNESFESDAIPPSLLDESIRSADLNLMDEDKKKMYMKIKKKRNEMKEKKIKDQFENDLKDFRSNNVFTELEELMKKNLSLKDLKRQIEIYIELIKGHNVDDETKYNIFLYLQRKEQLVQFLIGLEDNFEMNLMMKPEVLQDLRNFLKKRHTLVKADNEKRMKFTRPIVMQDGNGLSLFEEFKGEGISEWEIHMIMKYASYNQDVNLIMERLRLFKNDSVCLQRLRSLISRLAQLVLQTELDYLRTTNEEELRQQALEAEFNARKNYKSDKLKEGKKSFSQLESEKNELTMNKLKSYRKNNPQKFQTLVDQFNTVREGNNLFAILRKETAALAAAAANKTNGMWSNRTKQMNQTMSMNFIPKLKVNSSSSHNNSIFP